MIKNFLDFQRDKDVHAFLSRLKLGVSIVYRGQSNCIIENLGGKHSLPFPPLDVCDKGPTHIFLVSNLPNPVRPKLSDLYAFLKIWGRLCDTLLYVSRTFTQ